jgi:hypothetical protein
MHNRKDGNSAKRDLDDNNQEGKLDKSQIPKFFLDNSNASFFSRTATGLVFFDGFVALPNLVVHVLQFLC